MKGRIRTAIQHGGGESKTGPAREVRIISPISVSLEPRPHRSGQERQIPIGSGRFLDLIPFIG